MEKLSKTIPVLEDIGEDECLEMVTDEMIHIFECLRYTNLNNTQNFFIEKLEELDFKEIF